MYTTVYCGEYISFRHLSVKQGLSSNQIHSIFKDSQGFLWFASDYGLARYDGNSIKCFFARANDSLSLPGNQIRYVGKWIGNKLLVETYKGYTVYNPRKESFENRIYAWLKELGVPDTPYLLRMDSRNKIWIVSGSICYSYDLTQKRLRKEIILSPSQGNRIRDLVEYKDGIVAVTDKGLLVSLYSKEGKRRQINHIPAKEVQGKDVAYRLFTDRKGRIWQYSPYGVFLYPSGPESQPVASRTWLQQQKIRFPKSPFFFPRSMEEDESGRIWTGTDRGGIYILDETSKVITQLLNEPDKPYTLSGNSVNSLYKDDQGIMWVGTYKNGVSYYGKSLLRFKRIARGDVTSLGRGANNEVWIGTDNGELLHRADSGDTVKEVLTLPGRTPIVSLLYAPNKELWIGTYQGGLYRYTHGKLRHYGRKEGIASTHIWSLAGDKDGQIWVGTLGGGIQCISPETDKITTFRAREHKAMENDYIASLCTMRDGNIAGCSSTSVFIIEPKEKTIRPPRRFSETYFIGDGIHQVYEDSRKILWIATNTGLWAIPPTRMPVLWNAGNGLPQDQIHGITEDHEGTLWISTAQGITNIQLPSSGNLSRDSAILFNYNSEDALINNEPNLRALLTTRENEILCGNTGGLTLFNPLQVRWAQQTPKPVFTALYISGEEIQVGKSYKGRILLPSSLSGLDKIEVGSTQNMISLSFAPLEYNLSKTPNFMYQMEGLDKTWIMGDPNSQRVNYTSLEPGKYRLRIRYLTTSKASEESITELCILVHPPFYLSGWAFILYFVAMTLIGWFLVLWFRNKKQIQTIELKHKRDTQLNEVKQRFFTGISHDLRTPLTLIITPLETLLEERKTDAVLHSRLTGIHRNAKRLLHLVNELLDFRNSESSAHNLQLSYGDMSAFLHEITDFFIDYAGEKKITFRIHTDVASYPMLFDKDKLTKAITNLLFNAFKFTPENGQIVLSLTENKTSGETCISVTDSGIGIPIEERARVFEQFYQIRQPDNQAGGNGIGLSLVKEFVELHGGSIQISDGYNGTGSCFTIILPGSLRATGAEPGMSEKEGISIPPQLHKEKLLIVDDNPEFLDFLSENLSGLYTIQTATNGRKAWDSLLKDPPHLIISDVMMPEMDGNDLCRLVKHHRLTSHIPLILLTAKNSEESRIEGLTSGADEYLTKPFNLSLLKLRIFRFLEWSRSQSFGRAPIEPEPEKIEITSMDEQFIQNAVKYVESHIDNSELSVNEMGKFLCVSRAQLYKRMIALTGRSPIEFIRIIRIKRAHQLLSCSQQSVAEVAYQVGFNNPKYFSQYFKEEYGISPSDFRKRQTEEQRSS